MTIHIKNATFIDWQSLEFTTTDILVEEGLTRGDASALEEYAPIHAITYAGSVVVGPTFVVLTVLKQLGIHDALALVHRQSVLLEHAAQDHACRPRVVHDQGTLARRHSPFPPGGRQKTATSTGFLP